MTTTLLVPPSATAEAAAAATRRWLRELDRPAQLFENLGPNWFASVMGTAIVAVAAAGLPGHIPGLRAAAAVVWALALAWLAVLTTGWTVHWVRHTANARAHAHHPVISHFWGAPAMALLAVGAGAMSVGRDWIGTVTAVDLDFALWSAGTILGLVTCVWIPYLTMTSHPLAPDAAFGGWLMPVVPPMVSAATGAALIPHLPAGQERLTMLLACYAMFGISLFASVIIISQIWTRLAHHKVGPAGMTPTLWIVLGPLGQSVTAANLLGNAAPSALPRPYAVGAQVFGLLYGVPTWGFAMMWLALAAALTARSSRAGLPFSLTWWSFTFPVGTCVTGTTALALRLHSVFLTAAAFALFALLITAWTTVAVRTVRHATTGSLFLSATGAKPTRLEATKE